MRRLGFAGMDLAAQLGESYARADYRTDRSVRRRTLTGNPLAVVQAADELSEERMRRIASEFNQAETTFIL